MGYKNQHVPASAGVEDSEVSLTVIDPFLQFNNTARADISYEMQIPTATAALSGLLVAPLALGNTTPPAPSLSYLGTLNITLAPPIAIGVGPLGDRNFFAITGGTFNGPVLTGSPSLLPPFPLPFEVTHTSQQPSPPSAATGA